MTSQATLQNGAVKLIFDPRTRLPGERIEGAVELNTAIAKKDGVISLKVKIRGAASTEITQEVSAMSFGNAGVSGWKTYKSRNCFLKQEQVLWQVETQKEPRDSVVSFPFNFLLPKDVISSFYVEDKECKGIISYAIEVVAERLSVFKRNERVGQVFSVVAPADELQIEEAQRLGRGWDGTMTTLSASHQIKKMFWSQFPLAEAHVELPTLSSFPIGVPIPVVVIIRTKTKPMSQSDASKESLSQDAKKPLFPAPPSTAANIQFWLDSHHHLSASPADKFIDQRIHPLGGFGAAISNQIVASEEQPVWIPDARTEKGKGRWLRGMRFDSTITLACPPTMDIGIIKSAYILHMEVPFPGMGNNLHLKVPVHVNSE